MKKGKLKMEIKTNKKINVERVISIIFKIYI